MRIGIVGVHYGHIGGMLQSAQAAANGEIVGLVEADDSLYERYAAKANIPRFNSLEEMLAEDQPELVLEGLVHDKKVALVEACAKAGVHLLLDKPLCRTLDDWLKNWRAGKQERADAIFSPTCSPTCSHRIKKLQFRLFFLSRTKI